MTDYKEVTVDTAMGRVRRLVVAEHPEFIEVTSAEELKASQVQKRQPLTIGLRRHWIVEEVA